MIRASVPRSSPIHKQNSPHFLVHLHSHTAVTAGTVFLSKVEESDPVTVNGHVSHTACKVTHGQTPRQLWTDRQRVSIWFTRWCSGLRRLPPNSVLTGSRRTQGVQEICFCYYYYCYVEHIAEMWVSILVMCKSLGQTLNPHRLWPPSSILLYWAWDNLGLCDEFLDMNHAPGAGLITQPIDLQSSMLPLCYSCPN